MRGIYESNRMEFEMKRLLVIIPAYNESESIKSVIGCLNRAVNYADYLIINDGSSDSTQEICAKNHFNMLNLPINLGLAGAIHAGMCYALKYKYDYVIQIDGDGQHRPEYIEKMVKCMEETDADIVIGSRFKEKKKPMSVRMIGSRLISWAIYLTTGGQYIGDVTSGMRLYNQKMIESYAKGINYRPEPDTLAYVINHGAKVKEVQVEMDERTTGTSYLNVGNSIMYMVHVLFNILFFQWVRRD